ncbi:MAG TPA: hypothetical protein VKT19_07880 [Steroidobacteraceae bacterium]|nr:hypothetical protein [Steroidobacteraceae bacterium]
MRNRILILAVAAAAAAVISACGGGGGNVAAPPPPSATQSLATSQVLAQARQTSETSVPYPIDGGALVLTDTSDTTEPAVIVGP